VFLDRDGTINEDVGYLTDLANLVIYPYAADAIRLLRRAGFAIVVVTNQGGVGRGLTPTTLVEDAHRSMAAALARGGAHVDAWHYCPHHPEAVDSALAIACECRKPAPGMALAAARALRIDLRASWVVGDHWRDVQLGHAVGARSILIRTGHGRGQEAAPPPGQRVEAICDNLMHAVATILAPRFTSVDSAGVLATSRERRTIAPRGPSQRHRRSQPERGSEPREARKRVSRR
jgi:D-glycero-D-manno-heptose 1,7-bisphosphate phosphatase